MGFTNRYLFSAIEPLTGDSFHYLGFEKMDSKVIEEIILEMKEEYSDYHIVIVWDNATFHKKNHLEQRKI